MYDIDTCGTCWHVYWGWDCCWPIMFPVVHKSQYKVPVFNIPYTFPCIVYFVLLKAS